MIYLLATLLFIASFALLLAYFPWGALGVGIVVFIMAIREVARL